MLAGSVTRVSTWKKPGWSGAALYAVLGTLVSALSAVVCRFEISRQVGRRGAVASLPDGPMIVVANHTSLADGVLLAIAGRRLGRPFRMLGTAGIIEAPILRIVFKRLGYIPVKRKSTNPAGALEPAAEALRAGEVIAMYPEGRITRDRKYWPERSKTGAVRLALQTGVPIVPVATVGAERIVGRKRKLLSLIANVIIRPSVRMRVGEPIDVQRFVANPHEPSPEDVRIAADAVMTILVRMVEELRGERAPHPLGVPQSKDPE
jgi:1-acyl-sn-glycerol-3-phosphate acyltransferase